MKKRVLIVDDDEVVRESLARILREENYEVWEAGDGEDAVARYDALEVDVVLLDIILPARDGWDAFARLTTRNPALPVVVLTGHRDQYATAAKAGASAFVEKPADVPQLLAILARVLAEPRRHRFLRLLGKGEAPRYVARDPWHVFKELQERHDAPFRIKSPSQ